MIKIRYVYSNKKEIKTFIYTIEDIENNSVYEETTGFSRDFKLISRDRFTGLKDKNGVGIFENDLLIICNQRGVVEYGNYGSFYCSNILDGYDDIDNYWEDIDETEIISNTHIEALKDQHDR